MEIRRHSLEADGPPTAEPVGAASVRRGEFRPVLTIRATIDRQETSAFVHRSLQDIRAYVEEHAAVVDGAPFSICHSASATEIDLEVGWPVARYTPGTSRIHAGELPPTLLGHVAAGARERQGGN